MVECVQWFVEQTPSTVADELNDEHQVNLSHKFFMQLIQHSWVMPLIYTMSFPSIYMGTGISYIVTCNDNFGIYTFIICWCSCYKLCILMSSNSYSLTGDTENKWYFCN